jgi:hypothetical protein
MTRGIGTTTKQLKDAPQKALFIWCNNSLYYPCHLANDLGRKDLQIVGPGWIFDKRGLGRDFTAVVIDHALTLSGGERDRFWELVRLIRIKT